MNFFNERVEDDWNIITTDIKIPANTKKLVEWVQISV